MTTEMNKQEFVRELLDAMCHMAEYGEQLIYCGLRPGDVEFKSFRPGVADRLLFKKIVEDSCNNLIAELAKFPSRFSFRRVGLNLLNMLYAPVYLAQEERILTQLDGEERGKRKWAYMIETLKQENSKSGAEK